MDAYWSFIQDEKKNWTEFVFLSKQNCSHTRNYHISLIRQLGCPHVTSDCMSSAPSSRFLIPANADPRGQQWWLKQLSSCHPCGSWIKLPDSLLLWNLVTTTVWICLISQQTGLLCPSVLFKGASKNFF